MPSREAQNELLRAQMRLLRRAAGITQIDMAERLELTQSQVSKLERGESVIDVLLWRGWCLACGVKPGEVLDATFKARPEPLE